MTPKIGDMVWHLHHEILCEPLTEPFENRVAYIKAEKPKHEVATRLRLMKPVKDQRTAKEADAVRAKVYSEAHAVRDKVYSEAHAVRDKAYSEAYAVWAKALSAADAVRAKALSEAHAVRDKTYSEADAAWDKAYSEADAAWDKAYSEADAVWDKALGPLHAKECPNCPWDGRTIFPEAKA
jgi:hypothetical protein